MSVMSGPRIGSPAGVAATLGNGEVEMLSLSDMASENSSLDRLRPLTDGRKDRYEALECKACGPGAPPAVDAKGCACWCSGIEAMLEVGVKVGAGLWMEC